MIKIMFTKEESALLKKEKEYNPFPIIRKKCEVLYLKSQDFKHKEIQEIIGISHSTVTGYVKICKEGGIEALKKLNRNGQPGKLHTCTEQIKASLAEKPVRTLKEAKAGIKELTQIDLSLPQIGEYLIQIGIRRRKVKQIPDKTDIEEQERFKKEQLEPLIEKAQQKEIHVFFVDAAHFVLKPFLGFLYCLRVLFVKASAGRKRYNVSGALHSITKDITTITNCTYINSYSMCALLDKLTAEYIDLPIYIILDNAGYQKNKFVQAYAAHLGITSVYLPAYSPNLNLIERLWKFIKKEVLYSTYYEHFSHFTNAIDQCINDTKDKYKDEIHSLLSLNFQTFKNANIKP